MRDKWTLESRGHISLFEEAKLEQLSSKKTKIKSYYFKHVYCPCDFTYVDRNFTEIQMRGHVCKNNKCTFNRVHNNNLYNYCYL